MIDAHAYHITSAVLQRRDNTSRTRQHEGHLACDHVAASHQHSTPTLQITGTTTILTVLQFLLLVTLVQDSNGPNNKITSARLRVRQPVCWHSGGSYSYIILMTFSSMVWGVKISMS